MPQGTEAPLRRRNDKYVKTLTSLDLANLSVIMRPSEAYAAPPSAIFRTPAARFRHPSRPPLVLSTLIQGIGSQRGQERFQADERCDFLMP